MAIERELFIITTIGHGSPCDGEVFVRYFGRFAGRKGDGERKIPQATCGFLVTEGRVRFHWKAGEALRRKGDLFFVRRRQEMRWQIESRAARMLWFNLKGDRAEARLKALGLPPRKHLYSSRMLVPTLTRSFQRVRSGRCGPLFPIRIAWQILDTLSDAQGDASTNVPPLSCAHAEVCHELIETDYRNDLTIAGLARELGVDRTTLFRQFQALYGISPQQHLLATRMTRAEEMLQKSEAPIKQVAFESGFSDPDYFTRAFRQHHGVSPSAWRVKARGR